MQTNEQVVKTKVKTEMETTPGVQKGFDRCAAPLTQVEAPVEKKSATQKLESQVADVRKRQSF